MCESGKSFVIWIIHGTVFSAVPGENATRGCMSQASIEDVRTKYIPTGVKSMNHCF